MFDVIKDWKIECLGSHRHMKPVTYGGLTSKKTTEHGPFQAYFHFSTMKIDFSVIKLGFLHWYIDDKTGKTNMDLFFLHTCVKIIWNGGIVISRYGSY